MSVPLSKLSMFRLLFLNNLSPLDKAGMTIVGTSQKSPGLPAPDFLCFFYCWGSCPASLGDKPQVLAL